MGLYHLTPGPVYIWIAKKNILLVILMDLEIKKGDTSPCACQYKTNDVWELAFFYDLTLYKLRGGSLLTIV